MLWQGVFRFGFGWLWPGRPTMNKYHTHMYYRGVMPCRYSLLLTINVPLEENSAPLKYFPWYAIVYG